MKPFVIILIVIGLIFFILAAAVQGGMVTASGAGWLIPGGLAALALAWLLSLIP